jgi:hypothetical protein
MAGYWSIIIPESTTNLVTNPSIYDDTTGFTAVGGSIVRDTTNMKREIACLKITPTSGVNDGCYYGTVSLTTGISYTFSVDIKGTDGEPYTIYFANTSGVEQGTSTDFTANGEWERQEVTWACDSTASYRLYVTKNNDANTDLFYIDGLQCEAKAYSTTYVDGNQDGCKWIGAEHASTSERDAQSRAGGRLYNLDDYGFHIDDMPGIGMPPILHQTQEQPMLPGSLLRGFKTKPRVFDLIANQMGDTHEDLHSKRKDLLNAIKPDLVVEPQPFILRYTGANSKKPVEIKVVYDSGYQFTKLDGFTERQLPLRFIAYDEPYFYEVGDVAATLTSNYSVTAMALIGKVDKTWTDMGLTSTATWVLDITGDGEYLYIGGGFVNLNSDSNADGIARYNLETETWSAMGSGITAGTNVMNILVAPDGDIYVTGSFTEMGGVSNTAYIARWDGSSWNALGTGLDDIGRGMAFDADGNLYVAGDFANAGGSAASRIAKWDGSSWSALAGDTIDDNGAYEIEVQKNGNLYVCGSFTGIGSDSTLGFIAEHDGSSWSALGSGVNSSVYGIELMPDGRLYAGGAFTTAGGSSISRVAVWNGSNWTALGTGVAGGSVYELYFDHDAQLLYAGGAFTSAGGIVLADRLAIWNGSTWSAMDVDLAGNGQVDAMYAYQGNLYLGFNWGSGDSEAAYINTVQNTGTRSAYPMIIIERSGGTSATLRFIKNETTNAILYFDHSLLDGETLIVDCTPGKKSITSSMFGDSLQSLQRPSDFGGFNLLPGNNYISALIAEEGSPTIRTFMIWRNTHWSADGVAP